MNERSKFGCVRILAYMVVMATVGLGIIFLVFQAQRSSIENGGFSPSMFEATSGTILLTESGSGTDVFYFSVPAYCSGPRLSYTAWPESLDRLASVKFVVMQDNDEVRTTGPKKLAGTEDTTGVGVWSLTEGKYTLTVYGVNAGWMLTVICA